MSDPRRPDSPYPSRRQLVVKSLAGLGVGLVAIAFLLFVCAGTIRYWQAWLFLAIILIDIGFVFIYLLIRNPALLAKRLQSKERRTSQQAVLVLSGLLDVVAFVIPGFDFRLKWSSMPIWLSVVALIIMEAGFILYYIAIFQNRFASRVIEIQDRQTVIDTGLYSVVRHPMYLSMTLANLAMPLALGSFYSLIPMILVSLLLVARIRNEEALLLESLDGYAAYTKKVRYRLIPFVW